MSSDAYKRLRSLEEKLDAIELAFNIQEGEVNTVVRDLETLALTLLEEAVEKKVEEIFDEKIALVDSMEKKFSEKLAIVNSRISEAFDKANIPIPTVEKPQSVPTLKPFTKMQQERVDVLLKFMRMKATPVNRKQILEWAWRDVPKTSADSLLKLSIQHGLIELSTDEHKTLTKYGMGKYYILKVKKSPLNPMINPELGTEMKHTPMNKDNYFGDDLRDF